MNNEKTLITGRHLIELGYTPDYWFKDILREVNARNLGDTEIVKYIDEFLAQIIKPRTESVFYHKNITATSEDEKNNLEKVYATMDSIMLCPTVITGAIMPDACPAGDIGHIPVGGVVVTRDAIHPAMHSADICCSVMYSNFGKIDPKIVLDTAQISTHFGPGGRPRGKQFSLPESLRSRFEANVYLSEKATISIAQEHLGTQGDGNHFLFVGIEKSTGDTIIVTHHGSRAVGGILYKKGMRTAENFRKKIAQEVSPLHAWIPASTPEGKSYWEALQIVRSWTKYNHDLIHDRIAEVLGVSVQRRFWNEHNFVFRDDDQYFHAKGATPLLDIFVPDNSTGLRLIPLNMGQPVLVVRGMQTENNLGFAPHGAGRNLSRSGHHSRQAGKELHDIFREETVGIDVRFFSNEIDIAELPSAYKDALVVRNHIEQFGLGEVVDEILPYGCIMAGNWQKNAPWRKK